MQCGHCGAKRPNLDFFTETYREDGRFVVVRCLLCGWRDMQPDQSGYRPMGLVSDWPRREEDEYCYEWPLRSDLFETYIRRGRF